MIKALTNWPNAILGFLLVAGVLVYLIRALAIYAKRRTRLGELKHHIDMIRDPIGLPYEVAKYHLDQCRHIHEHYDIPLTEAGFDGDIDDLFAVVGKSSTDHKNRMVQ